MFRLAKNRRISFIILSGLLLAVGLFYFLRLYQNRVIAENMSDNLAHLVDRIHNDLVTHHFALVRLQSRWPYLRGNQLSAWENDVRNLTIHGYRFRAVLWLGKDNIVSWVYPAIGNEKFRNRNFSKTADRHQPLVRAIINERPSFSEAVELAQGGIGMFSFYPVFSGGRYQGSFAGAIAFDRFFRGLLEKEAGIFRITIQENNRTVFEGGSDTAVAEFRTGKELLFGEQKFRIEITPQRKTIENLTSILPGLIFFITLGFTVIVAGLYHFRAKAMEANQAKSNFLADMSHELRTPLTAILGFAEILRLHAEEYGLKKESLSYVERIRFAGSLLQKLMEDLLDFSALEAGKLQRQDSVFRIRDFLKEYISLFEASLAAKHMEVALEADPTLPETIVSDRKKLGQILLNLISNAVKFSPERSIILIRVYAEGSMMRISVKDEGPGISHEETTKLFRKFSRLERDRDRIPGVGLGLAIVKLLSEFLGGGVRLDSQPGKGSTFEVRIPLVTASAEGLPGWVDEDAPASGKAILILEDNESNRYLLQAFLSSFHHDLNFAVNGAEGLKKLRQLLDSGKKPDCIFMDIHMPDMTGFEAAREALKLDSNLAIFGISADLRPETQETARESGMKELLGKPLDFPLLQKAIKSVSGPA